jgi:hypothetical protein
MMRAVLSISYDSVNTQGEFAHLASVQHVSMRTLVSFGLVPFSCLLEPLNHLPP